MIRLILKVFAALLIPPALMWLSFGFILWNWSPETWTEGMRTAYVWLSFFLAIPSFAIVGVIE